MPNKRVKRLPKILLGQLCVLLLIIFGATSLAFYSMGYRINWKNYKIIKTGMIILEISPKPDEIKINNKTEKVKYKIKKILLPGYYDFVIKKDGYHDVSYNIRVEAEELTQINSIKLFLSEPQISSLSDQEKNYLLNYSDDSLIKKDNRGLTYSLFEIWKHGNLITRFSETINGVTWYPDLNHILFQQNASIKIIDLDGNNNTILVNLSSKDTTKFTINSDGSEIFFKDGNEYKKAKIR